MIFIYFAAVMLATIAGQAIWYAMRLIFDRRNAASGKAITIEEHSIGDNNNKKEKEFAAQWSNLLSYTGTEQRSVNDED